ncbi:UDP-galactopyranose mutase [Azospirillum brasilense]|nr:UDP-galactopyranose mutase [Azospirillum brasilense]TVZ48705.1 UDP-galactopyranose mutase [Azospirillum brasilense]TWB70586.1 UDP-galactopyranose mutase [Azospirillum brasilense]
MSWAGQHQFPIGRNRKRTRPTADSPHSDFTTQPSQTLICFSHLRWSFVYQRPQHLMSRFARDHRVLFVEEPIHNDTPEPWLDVREDEGVLVLVPRLPAGMDGEAAVTAQRQLLDRYLAEEGVTDPILWYYTPMSLGLSGHLRGALVVYDCMDELSAFHGAPPELVERERQLMARADVVFTGGVSLYEAKRTLHPNAHAFPSSVDIAHFAAARGIVEEPADQAAIPHPRLGFYGVIDERLDIALLDAAAAARPDWQFVLVGPVVKIDPADLPHRPNIHYLGPKSYDDLPHYLAGWDVALMPFARNESTRFISPTKTPEYLAAGRPVVSTSITDVVRGYGDSGVVRIADAPEDFVASVEAALADAADPERLRATADHVLRDMSWDKTQGRMKTLMEQARQRGRAAPPAHRPTPAIHPAKHVNGRAAGRRSGFDYLIVGAGFAGSVLAERLAAGLNKRVLLIDRRPHIGGNAYDHYDDAGVLIHRYGPHIFHTNAKPVADYLSRFTKWRPYEHRVLARVDERLVPIPINRTTVNQLYGLDLDEAGVAEFLKSRAEPVAEVRTSEDVVVGAVGRELYETFFRGYTRKQWGLDPSQLDKAVTARVPTRTNDDDRYFGDSFQAMPLNGYTRMFESMLDHPNIKVMLNTDFDDVRDEIAYDRIVFTGPIDEYFGHRFGKLPYRSLTFRHETVDREWFQPVAVVNEPSEAVPYTRVTEYKHLTGQSHPRTSITYEYPAAQGDPYYPIPRPENQELFRKYQALADNTPDVIFLGRLGTYRYYNMDQVVAQALAVYARLEKEEQQSRGLAAAARAFGSLGAEREVRVAGMGD